METPFDATIEAFAARTLGVPPPQVFHRLLRADLYRLWWPGHVRFEAPKGELREGGRVTLAALGARLGLEVVKIEPDRGVWFRIVSGPWAGTLEWVLVPGPGGARVSFRLRAEPLSGLMRALALIGRPGKLLSSWAGLALDRLEALRPNGPWAP